MYVRTRPGDKIRVVVTESDAQRIDEQWMVVNGTWEAHLADKARFEDERSRLAEKFGRAPSDRDVQWGICNRDLIEHAKLANWGLYRNTRLGMGDLLKKEGRSRNALMTYLEVSYIDSNGPNNLSGLRGIGKPFTPSASWASQAPAVVGYIEDIARELQMNESSLETHYLEVAVKLHSNLRMPLAPEKGWKRLLKELGNFGA